MTWLPRKGFTFTAPSPRPTQSTAAGESPAGSSITTLEEVPSGSTVTNACPRVPAGTPLTAHE